MIICNFFGKTHFSHWKGHENAGAFVRPEDTIIGPVRSITEKLINFLNRFFPGRFDLCLKFYHGVTVKAVSVLLVLSKTITKMVCAPRESPVGSVTVSDSTSPPVEGSTSPYAEAPAVTPPILTILNPASAEKPEPKSVTTSPVFPEVGKTRFKIGREPVAIDGSRASAVSPPQ